MQEREQRAPTERRCFTRVPCDAVAVLGIGDTIRRGQLVDISLKGVLIQIDDYHGVDAGATVEIGILLAGESPRIRMTGRCAHISKRGVGVRWERMDLESFWHLRRLIELNATTSRDSEHELAALLESTCTA